MKDNKDDKKQDLIQVFEFDIGGNIVLAVNARDIHLSLGIGKRFTTWILEFIQLYGFQEGIDYQVVFHGENLPPKNGKRIDRRGGHNRTEYILTLDMAKELSMIQRTETGRRFRRYFIECEKKLLNSRAQDQSDTELSDQEKREKQENIAISQMIRDRVFYWVLDKRDKIYRADMDRDILFSITLDIEQSITRDFNDDFQYFLDNALENNLDLSFSDFVKFIKKWKPYYIMEKILRHKQ